MIEETQAATVTDAGPVGFAEYEIDVERILRAELPSVFEAITIAPLRADFVSALPEQAKGAYVLYQDGRAVYAGKTDTRHGFRDRLDKHSNTIQHRRNLDPNTMGFKAVRILVFSNFDVEAILIRELRNLDSTSLAWNDSGFGSNDPGRNREEQAPAPWDVERPIEIDQPLSFMPHGIVPVLKALTALKTGLPYDFRYQTDLNESGKPKRHTIGHIDQRNSPDISIPLEPPPTVRSVLISILTALPAGWQATIFPGRVILYQEHRTYAFGLEYLRQG